MTVAAETVDRIAHRLLAPKNTEEMPVILCRRFFAHKLTYLQWDAGWEGLKKTVRNGRPYWEIDHNFNLRIELDGLCQIPDTPNNRKRLEKCSKPYQVSLTQDPITGIMYDAPKVFKYPAEYTRVDESILEKTIIEQIALRVMEMQRAEAAGEPTPLRAAPGPDERPQHMRNREAPELLTDEDLEGEEGIGPEEDEEPPSAPPTRRAVKTAPKPTKRKPAAKRGRPTAPDPLLAPIRERP